MFNPMATTGAFITTPFVCPEGTHRFNVISTPKGRKQKWGEAEMYFVDILTRIEDGTSETNGKLVTIGCQLGLADPDTGKFRRDPSGTPMLEFKEVAQIFHAAFGYQNFNKAEDERFLSERSDLDLSVDDESEDICVGSGWEQLSGCSFKANVSHSTNKKNPERPYLKFSYYAPVGA